MPAKNNEIAIDMVMDIKDYEDQLKKAETEARDSGKKISQELVVKMRVDIDNLTQKIAEAKAQLKTLDQTSGEAQKLRLDISQYKTNLTEAKRQLNNYLNTGETGISRLQAKFNQISSKMGGSATFGGQIFQQMGDGMGKVSELASGLVSKFGLVAVALGAINLGAKALELGDRLEQATISFTTMLGSAEKAQTLLSDLAIFAANTPFELLGLRDTAKQLLAFGIDADQIIPTLKALGDVSAGLSVPIQQIAYAFGQVKVAGRLMGGELMQFTNAGVPLIAELSKNLGVAQSDIKDMVSEGKIGFADVQTAFKTMSQESGKFANLMEKQAESLGGRWSNLKDKTNQALEQIGSMLVPFAKEVVDATSWTMTWIKNIFIGFSGIFELRIGFLIQKTFSFQIAWAKVSSAIAIVVNGIVGTFKDLVTNTGILAENIGVAFSNLPNSIKKYLNLGLKTIENFINSAGDSINEFAKKLGVTQDVVGKVTIGTLDVSSQQAKYKDFVSTNRDIAAQTNAMIMESVDTTIQGIDTMRSAHITALRERLVELGSEGTAQKKLNTELEDLATKSGKAQGKTLDGLNAKLKKLKEGLGAAEIGGKEFKNLQKEIKATEAEIDSLTENDKKGSEKKKKTAEELRKEEEKKKEEAKKKTEEEEKAELERQIRIIERKAQRRIKEVEESKLSEVEKAKAIVKINEDMEAAILKVKDSGKSQLQIAKDIVKAEEEKNKKVKEGQGIIQDYYDKVVSGAQAVTDKIDDLKKQIKELNEEIKKESDAKNTDIAQRRLDILEREKEIRKELAQLQTSGVDNTSAFFMADSLFATAGKDAKIGDVSLSEYEKSKQLQVELKALEAETIKNSAALDQKTFDELQKYKELSKTEQILADYEKEKAIQDKKLVDLQAQLATEEEEYKKIDTIKRELETTFTTFLKSQTDLRLTELGKLKQAAIEVAEALAKAGIAKAELAAGTSGTASTTSTTVNQTNNFTAKITQEDVKTISNQISKATQNAATGIK